MQSIRYRDGLGAALQGVALPYGYTVCIWSAGAAMIDRHGNPAPSEIALFAAGAVVAYGGLRVLAAQPHEQPPKGLGASPATVRAGVIHVAALAAAIASAVLVSLLGPSVAWALSTFVATSTYLAITGLEIGVLVAREQARR